MKRIANAAPSRTALVLGLAGAIPFAAGAAAVALQWRAPGLGQGLVPGAVPGFVLLAYAATIVAFLGGVHWGVAMHQRAPEAVVQSGKGSLSWGAFAWGVLPQLLAWAALLLPLRAGLAAMAALLVLCYAVDHKLYPRYSLQGWLGLRLGLSAAATASCALAAAML